MSLVGHRQTGGLYRSPSAPQLCLQTLLWLRYCVGCQQPAPTEWSVNVWHSHGLPVTVISHSLQLSVKHYPRCGSIKVWQLHYNGAGLCIPATSTSHSGFYSSQLYLKLLTYVLQVTSCHGGLCLCQVVLLLKSFKCVNTNTHTPLDFMISCSFVTLRMGRKPHLPFRQEW